MHINTLALIGGWTLKFKFPIFLMLAFQFVNFNLSLARLSPSLFPVYSLSNVNYIAGGISMGISLYNKLRLTGGLNLTDADRLVVDEKLEKKIATAHYLN